MWGARVDCQLRFSEGQTSGRGETIGALLIIIKSSP